jgi:immunoglobulin-binding protein 1
MHTRTGGQNHFETFQRNMDQLGIAPATTALTSSSTSATSSREHKIQAYRRRKELDAMVAELRARRASLAHEQEARGGEGGDLDEVERKLALAQMEQHELAVADSMSMIERELEMLQYAARMQAERGGGGGGAAAAAASHSSITDERASARVDMASAGSAGGGGRGRTPFLSQDGKVTGTFMLVNKREQLRKGVFGYGHNLPTMSIDEYLEQEMEQGNILSVGLCV